ncbi:MAG TPA: hypothetical protein DC015_13115 [Aequorivita sp.]|nr:hypothetical protein [Aequorivita sp.]
MVLVSVLRFFSFSTLSISSVNSDISKGGISIFKFAISGILFLILEVEGLSEKEGFKEGKTFLDLNSDFKFSLYSFLNMGSGGGVF